MTSVGKLDVLKCIEKLEVKQGFVRSNVKKNPPSFTDIWNLLLSERKSENPNPGSYKTMVFRLLKDALEKGEVTRNGKYYGLSDVGRAMIRIEDDGKMKVTSAYNTDTLSFIVYTAGPMVGDHSDVEAATRGAMKKIEDIIKDEKLPAGLKIVLKVDNKKDVN